MGTTKLNLKLLVDKKSKKVLFAEAGKEFVDFLFHLMSLPIATIVRLVNATDMVGCIGELYNSIDSLNSEYLISNTTKHSILNPTVGAAVPLLSLMTSNTTSDEPKKKLFYTCCSNARRGSGYSPYGHVGNSIHKYVTDEAGQNCPSCSNCMTMELAYVEPEQQAVDVVAPSEGYVKEVVTYMVMDHLAVKPMSNISGINLINEFGVKDIRSLVEKHVKVTLNEGVAILKSSLETRDVLTSVFLGKKI